MANKFLKTSTGLELSKLQNGSANLNINSLLIGGSEIGGGVSEGRVASLEDKTANQTANSDDTTFSGKVISEALQISDAIYDDSMSSSITMDSSEISIDASSVLINGDLDMGAYLIRMDNCIIFQEILMLCNSPKTHQV